MNELSSLSEDLVKLVAKTAQSVVAVKAGAYRTASGVIVDGEHIAVPDHTLKRRDAIPILTQAGHEAVGKVLGRDPSLDLAILHVEGITNAPVSAADPASLKPGMLAAVVGLTADVGPSVSLGIIGAVGPQRKTWRGGTLDHFIRLDVNLYPSQSGAAVVDSEGRLLGMATPLLSRHSVLTLPLANIRRVIDELLREGRIRVGYLGVGVQRVTIPASIIARHPGTVDSGLILLSVAPGAAADAAGLQVGDILLSLNGQGLGDVEDLQAQLRGEHIGQPTELRILRGGEPRTLSVTIAEAERKQV